MSHLQKSRVELKFSSVKCFLMSNLCCRSSVALKRVAIVCLIDSRQIRGVATKTTNCHYMFVLIPPIFHAIEVTFIDLPECPAKIFNPNALFQINSKRLPEMWFEMKIYLLFEFVMLMLSSRYYPLLRLYHCESFNLAFGNKSLQHLFII